MDFYADRVQVSRELFMPAHFSVYILSAETCIET